MLEVIREGGACIESNIQEFHRVESMLSEHDAFVRSVKEALAVNKALTENVEKLLAKHDLQVDEVRQEIVATKILVDHVIDTSQRKP